MKLIQLLGAVISAATVFGHSTDESGEYDVSPYYADEEDWEDDENSILTDSTDFVGTTTTPGSTSAVLTTSSGNNTGIINNTLLTNGTAGNNTNAFKFSSGLIPTVGFALALGAASSLII